MSLAMLVGQIEVVGPHGFAKPSNDMLTNACGTLKGALDRSVH